MTDTSEADAHRILESRPTIDAAEIDYKALITEIRDVFSDLAPDLTWPEGEIEPYEGGTFCEDPFANLSDAWSRIYRGPSEGAIRDDQWPAAEKRILSVAKDYGFTEVVSKSHRPGLHILSIKGKWGEILDISSAANTTLTLYGGCFIDPDKTPWTLADPPPSATRLHRTGRSRARGAGTSGRSKTRFSAHPDRRPGNS